jgi:small subunit ribosomal protein S6
VIKFITVRMDEEEKRLAKVKALRDSKVKRSAQSTMQHAPASISAAGDAPEPNADAEAPVSADPEASGGDAEPIATAV